MTENVHPVTSATPQGNDATPTSRRLTADPRLWRVIIAAALVVFAIQLDFFGVQVALPDMARDLGTSVTNLQWVVSGYMLATGSVLIVGGRIGDILGRRTWLFLGIGVFGLASLVGGLASSPDVVIGARLVQGVAAAFCFPLALAVVTNEFPPARVERAVGMVFAFAAVSQAFGPIIGSGLTELFSWRAVLLINVPVAVLAITLGWTSMHESRDETVPRHIDWIGLLLIVASIAVFTYAIDQSTDWGWTSAATLGLMAAGIVGLIVFVLVEQRGRYPLIDLSLFRTREFDLMTLAGTVGNVGTATVIFTSMILLQTVEGLSVMEAGVAFLGFSFANAIASQIAGRLESYPSWLVMSLAMLCGGVGTVAMGLVEGLAPFLVAATFTGLGFGMSWAFTSVSTQAVVPMQKAGEASGVVLTVLVTMGGVAVAVASSVIEGSGQASSVLEDTMRTVLLAAGALALVTSAIVAFLGRRASPPVAAAAADASGYR